VAFIRLSFYCSGKMLFYPAHCLLKRQLEAKRKIKVGRGLRGLNKNTKMRPAMTDAGWSSLVARRAHNPKVVGSNPAPATKLIVKSDYLDPPSGSSL
jgi:hypothetical protein